MAAGLRAGSTVPSDVNVVTIIGDRAIQSTVSSVPPNTMPAQREHSKTGSGIDDHHSHPSLKG